MDELDLARRAVRRHLVTDEQFKEARDYAEGGRSLVSVLLDLGYLRTEDLLELLESSSRPSPPRPRAWRWVAAALLAGLFGFALGAAVTARSRHPEPLGHHLRVQNEAIRKSVETRRSADRQAAEAGFLRRRGLDLLAAAEERLRLAGYATPEATALLRRAEALLLESIEQGWADGEGWEAVGRARERLLDWAYAAAAYDRAIEAGPSDWRALAGAARMALETHRPNDAFRHADRLRRAVGSAEAHFLRGRARFELGDAAGAREDFVRAAALDPSLSSAAALYLIRLPPLRQ